MASRIEDYALLSDMHTGSLLSRTGSLDWLCFPRFDSPSVFGALLGTENHGRWLVAPTNPDARIVTWEYLKDTFVVQTEWDAGSGRVRMTEFMPVGGEHASVVRRIEGLVGSVHMHQELTIRFGYGAVSPWVGRLADAQGIEVLLAVAGPDALMLHGDVLPNASGDMRTVEFTVAAGECIDLELTWYPSHRPAPSLLDVDAALSQTMHFWSEWAFKCRQEGKYATAVKRSLLVLRALTHEDTGGIVAAPTTSLPEEFGGARNWDYRYCWLRDAALTLEAMLAHGQVRGALHWRNWLLRAIAGDPEDLQIMYGLAGERELDERELAHLQGYENSAPVRIGNGAVGQFQADVVGEVLVALEKLRHAGGTEDLFSWPLQRALLEFQEKHFQRKDLGIWEMRGEPMYFTHSRVMMWAAFDCGVRAVHEHGLDGPVKRWTAARERLRQEILSNGFDTRLNSFTQVYGGSQVDASLLIIPQVGFLPYDHPKMLGTVAKLENELFQSGLLLRYRTETGLDGLEAGEHPFLACSFWLVEQYAHSGRKKESTALMNRLVGLRNELGLLSEEYAIEADRMAGNFPQAFSHLALIRAADAIQSVERLSAPAAIK